MPPASRCAAFRFAARAGRTQVVVAGLGALLAGCRSAPAARPATPLAAPAAPQQPPVPDAHAIRASCDERPGDQFADWQRWMRDNLGQAYALYTEGPDPATVARLMHERPDETTRMLRRGLEACDYVAAQALGTLKQPVLLPELRNLTTAGAGRFRVEVLSALAQLDPVSDYAPALIAPLSSGDSNVRLAAAAMARYFHFQAVRAPLMERVRRDGSSEVRVAAAQSLLILGDVYPRSVYDHRSVFENLIGQDARAAHRSTVELLSGGGTPTEVDLAHFAAAAGTLDQLLAERAASGKCSPLVRLDLNHLHFSAVNANVAALLIDEAESSCQRELAFAVFIEAPAAFGTWLPAELEGKYAQETAFGVPLAHGKLQIRYRRDEGILRLGDVELKRSDTNLAVIVVTPRGTKTRYTTSAKLTFPRDVDPKAALLLGSDELRSNVEPP